jgi:hypothetical protein
VASSVFRVATWGALSTACGSASSAGGLGGTDAATGSPAAADAQETLEGASWLDAGLASDSVDAPWSSDAPGALDAPAPTDGNAQGAGLALPSPLYGVTVDDISSLSDIVLALGVLPHKPTTRIVFDEGQSPAYYAQAVAAISAVSYVMGEILDSAFVKNVSPAAYQQRTSDYLSALSTGVDLWEVGNEINGNWLGSTADVVAKMTGAYNLVKSAGGKTELTLYGCSDSDQNYDMIAWAKANVPPQMAAGLDYVLVSYYEGDCGSPRAASEWPGLFQQLRGLFPNAGVGFGEVGSVDSNGQDVNDVTTASPYLQKYYGMKVPVTNYVGGYFWWYFREDMVPSTLPLFPILSAAIK